MSFTIVGTGSALPPHTITNDDLTTFLDTSDEWITARTGIKERHVLQGDETVTDLAIRAGMNALEDAGLTPKDLDFILCPTIGGDYITPSLASVMQGKMGAKCPAMDLNAACSGFMYGLEIAASLLAHGTAKRVLLVAAEGLSRISDWSDRRTCVLFGDGAGAVVLEKGDDLLYMNLTSHGWADPLYYTFPDGTCPGYNNNRHQYLVMDGGEVYKFAVSNVVDNIRKALNVTGIEPGEVDHMLLHQANLRIIDAAKRRLGIPEDRYTNNIERVGNISAVSIPLLLDECCRAGKISQGETIVMSGFGGGLTTGTAIIRWGRAN